MKTRSTILYSLIAATIVAASQIGVPANVFAQDAKTVEILNVSYDPTRELYKEFNNAFSSYWEKLSGQKVVVKQSHGGSGTQARSVIDGLKADVLTLALAYDIDAISEKANLLPKDWQSRLPNNSAPYRSTVVFLVRKGNPKGIKNWEDLIKPGVEVITPNPKTSGGARWNYIAAWGYILKRELGDLSLITKPGEEARVKKAEASAHQYIAELYKHVPVLDTGARGSTNTFVQREIGDVFISWENEALLAINELGPDKLEIVVPSFSVLAEPPVALVDKNAKANAVEKVADAYLQYLYSPVGQQLAAKHYYRPLYPEQADPKDMARFPKVETFTIEEVCGGWQNAHKTHFADGGIFDQIYLK